MTVADAHNFGVKKLRESSASPALDAEVLLSHVLKKDRAWLFANPNRKLTGLQLTAYNLLIRHRANHWPIAYLTGHKEFYGLDFRVTKDVLIPRPDTELLVELALNRIENKELRIKEVVDLGTGSGCIIIALSVILRRTRRRISRSFGLPQDDKINLIGTDSSAKALAVARANARAHGVEKKIRFRRGNLLAPVLSPLPRPRQAQRGGQAWRGLGRGRTIIIANLPYLTPSQYNSNPDLAHEPRSALVAGKDGLKYYRELFRQIKAVCHSEGTPEESQRSFVGIPPQDDNKITILLEHDPAQVAKLKSLAKKYFPHAKLKFHKDLSGAFRIMEFVL